eukprot:2964692-Amphidinium_carterae.2
MATLRKLACVAFLGFCSIHEAQTKGKGPCQGSAPGWAKSPRVRSLSQKGAPPERGRGLKERRGGKEKARPVESAVSSAAPVLPIHRQAPARAVVLTLQGQTSLVEGIDERAATSFCHIRAIHVTERGGSDHPSISPSFQQTTSMESKGEGQ